MRKQSSGLLLLFLCLGASVFLTGCGYFRYVGLWMPDVNLQPSSKMNPGENGEPLPTGVRIYQLTTKDKMEKSDFKSLWKNDKAVLDDTLLAKKEVTVYPGKIQEIEIKKKSGASYIGVMAIFRKPNEESGKWKYIVKLTPWTFGSQDIDLIIGKDALKAGVLGEEAEEAGGEIDIKEVKEDVDEAKSFWDWLIFW